MSARKPRRAETPTPPAPAVVSLPPLAAAIGRLVAGGMEGIPDDYLRAWQHVAGIVQTYADSTDDSRAPQTRYAVLDAMIEDRIAKSRTGTHPWERSLARAVDLLNHGDDDALLDVKTCFTEPAFFLGLALGVYVLTNTAPLTIPVGGGR